jgi:hypothetical protein
MARKISLEEARRLKNVTIEFFVDESHPQGKKVDIPNKSYYVLVSNSPDIKAIVYSRRAFKGSTRIDGCFSIALANGTEGIPVCFARSEIGY